MSSRDEDSARKGESQPALDEAGLRAFLAAQPDIAAVYLFGSQAQGRASPRSDVDIAVLLRDASDPEAVWKREVALEGGLKRFVKRDMDMIILNTAPPILQHQVLRHGRLLYEGDRLARVEFEVRAGKIYADLKPMYDFHTRDLLKKIKEVGLGGRRRRRRQPAETAR